jgi:hypothetical protein
MPGNRTIWRTTFKENINRPKRNAELFSRATVYTGILALAEDKLIGARPFGAVKNDALRRSSPCCTQIIESRKGAGLVRDVVENIFDPATTGRSHA